MILEGGKPNSVEHQLLILTGISVNHMSHVHIYDECRLSCQYLDGDGYLDCPPHRVSSFLFSLASYLNHQDTFAQEVK